MDIIALVLSLLATGVFLIEFARSNWTNMTSIGLALFAGGFAAFIAHLLEESGKL
jgi:hypothetical protein